MPPPPPPPPSTQQTPDPEKRMDDEEPHQTPRGPPPSQADAVAVKRSSSGPSPPAGSRAREPRRRRHPKRPHLAHHARLDARDADEPAPELPPRESHGRGVQRRGGERVSRLEGAGPAAVDRSEEPVSPIDDDDDYNGGAHPLDNRLSLISVPTRGEGAVNLDEIVSPVSPDDEEDKTAAAAVTAKKQNVNNDEREEEEAQDAGETWVAF
ncbi:hypothetical protein G7054_g14232 [Neopestalotiopsis clavispora]|nr:hypothetical protein G7054_g14232 [Neopestalotiopsis clavispora]